MGGGTLFEMVEKFDSRNISNITEKGFDYRIVEYEEIHKIKEEDFHQLVSAIDPKPGQVILDGMDGYGAVSKHILEEAEKDNFKPEIYTLDESVTQIERARKNIPDIDEAHITQADIRETRFPDNKFDSVVIKMGVHELPQAEQPKIFKEMYRIIKPGGKFVIWELALNEKNQKIFQEFIREKDRLAGFDKLVKNRYFPRHDELRKLFEDAGFVNVQDHYWITYEPSTLGRLQELVSKERKILLDQQGVLSEEDEEYLARLGKERVGKWNEFARKHFPENLKGKMKYKDIGDDIQFEIKKIIMLGQKLVPEKNTQNIH